MRQLALQGAAVILVLSLAWPYFGWQAEAMPWLETSLAIGAVALTFATISRQPWWWRVIHAGFMPLIWLTHGLAIDPAWFLAAFVMLLLVYRGALSGQVPLYLSNRQTVAALAELLAEREAPHFLDLGAGLGVPMPELWAKVEAEMRPGSLFISNTFPVPGVTPSRIIEVDCQPPRPLYCYQR